MIGSLDNAARHDLLDGSFGDSETFLCSAALSHRFGGSLASCATVLLAGAVLGAGVAPRNAPLAASTDVGSAGLVLQLVGSSGGLMWDDVLADGVPCYCGGQVANDALCSPGGNGEGGAERGVMMAAAVATVMAEGTAATVVNATGMAVGVKVECMTAALAASLAAAVTMVTVAVALTQAASIAVSAMTQILIAAGRDTAGKVTTAMMLVSAKAVAVEVMSEATMMFIVVTLAVAQATAATAITVVSDVAAARNTVMAIARTPVQQIAAITAAALTTIALMAADATSEGLSMTLQTAGQAVLTAVQAVVLVVQAAPNALAEPVAAQAAQANAHVAQAVAQAAAQAPAVQAASPVAQAARAAEQAPAALAALAVA